MIDTGNTALQLLDSVSPDVTDPRLLTSVATLVSAIRGCIAEYTKIHNNWVKFKNTQLMEKQRFENKKALLRYKAELSREFSGKDQTAEPSGPFLEVKSTDLLEFMLWKKARAEEEAAKAAAENNVLRVDSRG